MKIVFDLYIPFFNNLKISMNSFHRVFDDVIFHEIFKKSSSILKSQKRQFVFLFFLF